MCVVVSACFTYLLTRGCRGTSAPSMLSPRSECSAVACSSEKACTAYATKAGLLAPASPSAASSKATTCKTWSFIGTTTTGSSLVHCKLYWVPTCSAASAHLAAMLCVRLRAWFGVGFGLGFCEGQG